MAIRKDSVHPILPRASEWEIVGLNLQGAPEDGSEPYLDLTLRCDGKRVRLRFWSPQDLSIEKGGPCMTHGLAILDVKHRGMEGMAVLVDDLEGSEGSVRFLARDVVELR